MYPAGFDRDGIQYKSSEHYIQAMKAETFNDDAHVEC